MKIANNTKLNFEGAAVLNFSLKLTSENGQVLFNVANESLENPIFAYNSVEHLFVPRDNPEIFDTLMPAFCYKK